MSLLLFGLEVRLDLPVHAQGIVGLLLDALDVLSRDLSLRNGSSVLRRDDPAVVEGGVVAAVTAAATYAGGPIGPILGGIAGGATRAAINAARK